MMKKVLCVLLAVLMLLSMAACSKEEPQDTANVPVTSEDTQPQKETTEATEETKKEEESLQEFMFPLMPVFCKVSEQFVRLTNGMVAIASGSDEYVLSIYNGFEGDYTGELEGLLAGVADFFVTDLNKYLSPNMDENTLKEITGAKTSISGYDAVKFDAPVKNKSDETYEIYGYAMIIDNTPVVFMGIHCSEDQAQADLEEMQELVDLMAGSIYK